MLALNQSGYISWIIYSFPSHHMLCMLVPMHSFCNIMNFFLCCRSNILMDQSSLLVQNENPWFCFYIVPQNLDGLLTCWQYPVYSSWEVGKLKCFSLIKERFGGPGVRFCAIGDGPEECQAAQFMRWPFIRINLRPDAFHRFPGLTMETISCCINTADVIDAKNGNK